MDDDTTLLIIAGIVLLPWVLWLISRSRLKKANKAFDVALRNKELKVDQLQSELEIAQSNEEAAAESMTQLQAAIESNDVIEIQESFIYQNELDNLKALQKNLKSKFKAVKIPAITFDGSSKKGEAIMKKIAKLTLLAFDGEADRIIKTVKADKVSAAAVKIQKLAEKVSKMLAPNFTCTITRDYVNLKLEELHLYHRKALAVQAEKEAERAFKEELREQEKAEREHVKAVEDAGKEARLAEDAFNKAVAELQGQHSEELDALRIALAEAQAKQERAKSQAQLTKSGHIYVIKNTGSFGSDRYKVGMTRRLVPMDRVKELGDASVPFPFAVCAMIKVDNAPTIEKELHNALDVYRVNKANKRKEFFDVSIDVIEEEARKLGLEMVFDKDPEELEWTASH